MDSIKNSIKSKWTKHITARRIRNLWNEYTKVAEIKDASVVTQKLNTFLDSFQESYKELVDSGQIKSLDVDKIFGDCTDILVSLLDLVERESNNTITQGNNTNNTNNSNNNNSRNNNTKDKQQQDGLIFVVELINKSLGVAELILHDEKYKVVVKETPNLIYRILALLDTLNTIENKKVLLRIISAVGENPDNRMEIGRLEGFKKILLLMHNDKELTQEILRTIRHFLDTKQITNGSTQNSFVDEELLINMRKSLSMSSISEFARHKIGTAVSEGIKVIVGEFQKVFSPNDSDHIGIPRKMSIEKAIMLGNDIVLDDSFIPSFELIENEINGVNNNSNSITNTNNDQLQRVTEVLEDTSEQTDNSDTTMTTSTTDEEEVLKEFMRVQGALTSLVNSIQEAALIVQLDLLETISRLLYNNQKNQAEFRNMDGYSILIHLFDNVNDFTSQEGRKFLEDCFSIIFIIILDGNKSKRIMNMDALDFLFKTLSTSTQTHVKLQALICIQDLISINPLNIVNIKKINGVDKLFDLIFDIFNDNELQQQQDQQPFDEGEDDKTKLLLATSELILYLGVLFSKHDSDIFKKYINLVHDRQSLNASLQSLLIQSSITLLSDNIYHKVNIDNNLITIFISIIENYQDELYDLLNQSKITTQAVEVEEEDEETEDVEDKPLPNNNYELKQSLIERILLMLELMSMYLKYNDQAFKEFILNHDYMKLLVSLTKIQEDKETNDISDTCFWIINSVVEMESYPHTNVNVLVSLLEDQSISNIKRERLCYCIANMLLHHHEEQLQLQQIQQQIPSSQQSQKVSSILKISIQELGGLNALVNIIKSTTSTPTLIYSALVALCELCFDCEENRMKLDGVGFMALSAVIKSTHLIIDDFLYQLLVELSMNKPVLIRYQYDYLQQIFSPRVIQIVANIITPQPQYTSLLPYSKRQCDMGSYRIKSSSSTTTSTGTEHHQPHSHLYGDEINLGDDGDFVTKDSPNSSPPQSLSNSQKELNQHSSHSKLPQITFTGIPQQPPTLQQRNLNSSGSKQQHQQQYQHQHQQQQVGIIRIPSFNNYKSGNRRGSFGSWAGSFDDLNSQDSYQHQQQNFSHFDDTQSNTSGGSGGFGRKFMNSSNNSNPQTNNYMGSMVIPHDDKETLYSYTMLGKSRIRSPDAALMLVDLLPHSPPHIQQQNLVLLMKILESNPQNKKMLSAAQGLKYLLFLSNQSPEETQSYYSRLIVILGLYDISPSEVRLLFDLACFPSFESHPQFGPTPSNTTGTTPQQQLRQSKNRKQELQMQLLYVIGTLTERKTPPLYFNFDGFDSYIKVGTIDRFPSQRNGYTFSSWIKTNYFLSDEAGLFSWQDAQDNNIFEVYFKQLGKHENKRYLCVQIRNYPLSVETFSFDKFAFSECGSWHHIVITHSKQKIALYIDGKFVQNYSTVNYPKLITKDKPIQGCIGKRTYTQLTPGSSNHNSSSNLSNAATGGSQPVSSHSSLSSIHESIDSIVTSSFAGNTVNKNGYFCGQMGTIHFFDGIWEAPSCHKVYSRGNLYNNSYKQLGIENKEFLVIKPTSSSFVIEHQQPQQQGNNPLSMSGDQVPTPSSSIPIISSPPSSPTIVRNPSLGSQLNNASSSHGNTGTSSGSNLSIDGSNSSGGSSNIALGKNNLLLSTSSDHLSPVLNEQPAPTTSTSPTTSTTSSTSTLKKSTNLGNTLTNPNTPPLPSPIATQGAIKVEFMGGVNVHQTRCLKDVIKEVGGIHLCFPFLDMAPAQQVAGLRILAGLLHKSESNKLQFRDLNGFAILYHLLLRFSSSVSSASELSMETFEILFDMLLDGLNNQSDPKHLWSHDCMTLILDLLTGSCSEELQVHVLKSFSSLLANSSYDTLKLWITNGSNVVNPSSIMVAKEGILSSSTGIPSEINASSSTISSSTSSLGSNTNSTVSQSPNNSNLNIASSGSIANTQSTSTNSPIISTNNNNNASIGGVLQITSNLNTQEPIPKINYLLALSLKMDSECTFLLNIIKKILPHLTTDDLESVFEYLIFCHQVDGVNVYEKIHIKAKIIELAYEEMRKSPTLLENLRSLGGFNIVFSLMELPSDEIKVTAIKLIGLLMHSNSKAASLFKRNSGFDLLATLLCTTPPTITVCRALLVLMVDGYKFDPKCVTETKQRSSSWISLDFFTRDKSYDSLSSLANQNQSSNDENNNNNQDEDSSNSTQKGTSGDRTIVYPEALHTLFLILSSTTGGENSHQVEYQSLFEIERLMDTVNMEILWNQSWFEWLYQFVEHQGYHLTKENNVYNQALSLCKKMVMQDIIKKTSKIIKIKEVCIDYEEFYVHIVESVLEHFEKDFVLPSNEATDIIKNLVIYFKSLEDIAIPPDTSMRILNAINQLAFHNTPSIRTTMKSNGLFEIRDNLIIQLLRCDIKNFIVTFEFDFECVVDQKAFRESNNGLLYLLYFFHLSVNDTQLQYIIYGILKNVFGASEENRKIISSILEDATVIQMFFDVSMDEEGFIDWYYREDFTPKRIEIETRIGKLMAPVETKYNSQQEKLIKLKEKRIKQRREKNQKQYTTIQKIVLETEEKRKARATKMITQYANKEGLIPLFSKERLTLGKEKWESFKHNLCFL